MTSKYSQALCVLLLSMLCVSCGEGLWAGGASIQGTGDPKPNNPGPADDHHKFTAFIRLSAPVVDECNGLKRQLRFLDTVTHEPINETSILNLNHQFGPNGTMLLELTVTNTSNETVVERQPNCYVPASLYLQHDPNHRIFPEQQCLAEQDISYQPQQTKTYEIPYMTAGEIVGTWKYTEESVYFKHKQRLTQCGTLDLSFEVYKIPDDVLE